MKEKAYKALICPTLEYFCSIWDPLAKTQSQRVEMVKCRAAKWVTCCYHNTSGFGHMLEWQTLAQVRANYRLVLFYKVVYGLVGIDGSNHFIIHCNGILIEPIIGGTQYYELANFPHTIVDWRLP